MIFFEVVFTFVIKYLKNKVCGALIFCKFLYVYVII
ncbi:MAG: Response regulator receiver [Candidatus Tokpelaia sp. JSC188]|nr:MAG: Response regulator receiver [Candidatus Tokpelaia sp. JSC188]